jgi:hypothetical protein
LDWRPRGRIRGGPLRGVSGETEESSPTKSEERRLLAQLRPENGQLREEEREEGGRERHLIEMDLIGPAGTSADSGDTSARRAAHHRIDQRGLRRQREKGRRERRRVRQGQCMVRRDLPRVGVTSKGDLREHVLEQRQGIGGGPYKSRQSS